MNLLVFLMLYVSSTNSLTFNVKKVTEISLENYRGQSGSGTYFGYSLLLQRGSTPRVIIGAPKVNSKSGGGVFGCNLNFQTNSQSCAQYAMNFSNSGSFNGNFLGSAIDGEDEIGKLFVSCAPRKVTEQGAGAGLNYFLKGNCFFHVNSSVYQRGNIELAPLKTEVPISSTAGTYYYDYAFGQAGLDIAYDRESKKLIMGAPGIKNWDGGIVSQSLTLFTEHKIIPYRTNILKSEDYEYLGYTVGIGELADTSFIFGGAPRSEYLIGKVKLFNDGGLYRSFKGEETGAYFGSAVLAEDVNNDDSMDLFVGAPMTAGLTYDEGCVYYYKNSLTSSIKLLGIPGKKGARFGTNIVALGDIDLDNYNDIAISAPFEDNGIGAVYIFMGSKDGIKTSFKQRLTPRQFSTTSIRGFGMGISRGNDVDFNGHNDLAIGAYLSGHVFVIRSKYVIDFKSSFEANVTSITSSKYPMDFKYCVQYTPRSNTGYLKQVNFRLKVVLDYRVIGKKTHTENVTVDSNSAQCRNLNVDIENNIFDISSFKFSLSTDVIEDDIIGEGTKTVEKSIPYSHGCGDDNICQTKIIINVLTDTDNITLGQTKVLNAKISAENMGEPGYQCELYMEIPEELHLREERKCGVENSTYICPFTTKLDTEKEKAVAVKFDVVNIEETTQSLELSFEVKCLGENEENKQIVRVGIVVKNSPYIEGKSEPEDYEYSDENAHDTTSVDIYHQFTLSNFGPSPVKADVHLLVPIVKIGSDDLFHFIEARGNLKGVQVDCYPVNKSKVYERPDFDPMEIVKASLNRTDVFSCFEKNAQCLELICSSDYLYKSSENAKYVVRFSTRTDLLAKYFKGRISSKNIIAYITTATIFNGTTIEGHVATLMLSSHASKIPLWVYILSAILGIVLLGLLVFVFYKCHFFDRRYQEKMKDERLMDQQIEMDSGSPMSFNSPIDMSASDTEENDSKNNY